MWIEELPDGKFKYFERYKDPYTDKWRKKSITLTSGSRQARKQAQKELDDKIAAVLKKKTTADHTFHDVFDEWLISHEKTIRPTTFSVYKVLENHIKEKIPAEILINNIDTRYMQAFFDSLNFSNDYVMSFKSVLNLVFRYAWKLDFIDNNPMDKVEVKTKAKTNEDLKRINSKFLEKDEFELLLKELYRRPSTYRVARLAEFMYLTGTRIGEAIILTLDDVDFENKILSITGTLDRTKGYRAAIKGPTKTNQSNRDITLTQRTIDLIIRTDAENKLHRQAVTDYVEGGYLFVTKSGTPMPVNSFNLALKGAGERVGIKGKVLSSHIFRHTHISMLAELGLPEKSIMDRVGHEDSSITRKIYTHVTKGMKEDVLSKLENSGF